MRKILRKIHLYGGLIGFWYLIILGTSSLNFNHHFGFMNGDGEPIEWSQSVIIDEESENRVLAKTLRDSIDLIGWPLFWTYQRDSINFKFNLEQPGKSYLVSYSFKNRMATVIETPKGFWRSFNALHGMGSIPNSSITWVWGWYTHLIVVIVLFSLVSGLYLWFSSKLDRKAATIALITSVLITSLWMVQLYYIG